MSQVFKKLNLEDQTSILVLDAPETGAQPKGQTTGKELRRRFNLDSPNAE